MKWGQKVSPSSSWCRINSDRSLLTYSVHSKTAWHELATDDRFAISKKSELKNVITILPDTRFATVVGRGPYLMRTDELTCNGYVSNSSKWRDSMYSNKRWRRQVWYSPKIIMNMTIRDASVGTMYARGASVTQKRLERGWQRYSKTKKGLVRQMTRFLNFNKTLSLNIIHIFSYLRDCVYYHIWDDLIKLWILHN